MDQEASKMNEEEFFQQVEKFDEELKRMQQKMRQEEINFERRKKPLPEKLYHVTTFENAQQIRREGLDPSKLIFSDDETVSLSDDIDFALRVVEKTQNTNPRNLVVLEIDTRFLTPSRVHNFLRTEDSDNPNHLQAAAVHEVHYEATIPPEAIKMINYEKKKETE